MKKTIPRWFVRLYLKVKGWQDTYDFRAESKDGREDCDFVEHPIRWLWERIQQRCPYVAFSTLHGWDRQVGRDTGEMEPWGRWIDWSWNYEEQGWECVDMEYNVDGYPVIPQTLTFPRIGTIISRRPSVPLRH